MEQKDYLSDSGHQQFKYGRKKKFWKNLGSWFLQYVQQVFKYFDSKISGIGGWIQNKNEYFICHVWKYFLKYSLNISGMKIQTWTQISGHEKNKSEKKKPKIQGGLVGYFPLEDNNRVRNEDLN